MKRLILTLAAVSLAAVLNPAFGQKKLKSTSDSLTYAIAVDMLTQLENVETSLAFDLNFDIFMAAANDFKKKKPAFDHEYAIGFIREYMSERLPAIHKKRAAEEMASILKDNPRAQKTASGLFYEIVNPGDGIRPMLDTDRVTVHYVGKLMNGEEFDSSYERGETSTFALNRVIAGWTEGLKLIGTGGIIRLWIPYDLAYGENGRHGTIPPYATLYFEVELFDVEGED